MKRKLTALVMAAALTAAVVPAHAVDRLEAQFADLDIADYIGGPLKAQFDAQTEMLELMEKLRGGGLPSFQEGKDKQSFTFERPAVSDDGTVRIETTVIDVPFQTRAPLPGFSVDDVTVEFEMEVKKDGSSCKVDDTDGLDAEECVELLKELSAEKVLEGNEQGDPMLDETVTQGAMLKMLAAAQDREPKAAMDGDHWAAPWGGLAVDQGWLKAEELDYDRTLTVGGAAALLSRATGYAADAEASAGGQDLNRFQAAVMVHDLLHLNGEE